MSFATSPAELFLMIGEREFNLYKVGQLYEAALVANKDLTNALAELKDKYERLERAHNDLQLQHRSASGSKGKRLRRNLSLSQRPHEHDRRDAEAGPVPENKAPGAG